MRPVLMGDVTVAARALLGVRAGARAPLARRLIAEAQLADRHRAHTGRAHPLHGNGSLMAAATARHLPPEPPLADAAYLHCLIAVIEALALRAEAHGARARRRRAGGCEG